MKTNRAFLFLLISLFTALITVPSAGKAQCTDAFNDATYTATSLDDLLLVQALAQTAPNALFIELWQAQGAPTMPGIYAIEDDPLNNNYSTCHTCILLIELTSTHERIFFATSAEIIIDSIGLPGELLVATLSNIDLVEVTLDPVTFESTPVPGGEVSCIDSIHFNTTIQGEIVLDNDGDGILDDEESIYGTDPNNPDSDNDMLLDGDEVFFYGTDPLNPDTDAGGVIDGQEILIDGTDPFNPTDDLVPVDEDEDGYFVGQDCNDNDPAINPGAQEIWYDGIDQNCDGLSDFDQDGDGSLVGQDCDDTNLLARPGLGEFCDGYDNNCDGIIDDQGPCLAVQLTWNTPADPNETDNIGSDLDLHFLHPNGDWWEIPWDIHWANLHPNWGDPNSSHDDPNFVIDDVNGLGPEIVGLSYPESGAIYKVGIHYFNAHGFGPSLASVKVFVNGQMKFEDSDRSINEREFLEIAAIDWDTGSVTSLIDLDNDGIPDELDSCPNSDLSNIVIIDDCSTDVLNHLDTNGCTISDRIAACAADANNHGSIVSCVAHLTNSLTSDGIINGEEKGTIQSCAAKI